MFKFSITSRVLPLWGSGEGYILLSDLSDSESNMKMLSWDKDLLLMVLLTLEGKEKVL